MSNDAPPSGYRSWLHYTVEHMRNGSISIDGWTIEMLEADLKMEDSNKIADARNVREFIKNWRPT